MMINQHCWHLIFYIKFNYLIKTDIYISNSIWFYYFRTPPYLYIIPWVFLQERIVIQLNWSTSGYSKENCRNRSQCTGQGSVSGPEESDCLKLLMNLFIFPIANTYLFMGVEGHSITNLLQHNQNFLLYLHLFDFHNLFRYIKRSNFASISLLPLVIR